MQHNLVTLESSYRLGVHEEVNLESALNANLHIKRASTLNTICIERNEAGYKNNQPYH